MLTSAYFKFRLADLCYGSNNTNSFTIKDITGTDVSVISASSYYTRPGRVSTSTSEQQTNANWGSLYIVSNGSTAFYGSDTISTNNIPTGGCVVFGDGDTPATIDDYNLAGNMITTFTCVTAVSAVYTNNKIQIQGAYTITNTGASAFTIKEVCGRRSVMGVLANTPMIWFRTVLENPVTIQPGNSGIVTITMLVD